MLEDTAILDGPVDTDIETDYAPLPSGEPENADLNLLPETGEGEEETPETEQPETTGKTEDELRKDPAVAALLEKELKSQAARLNESARRKAENAANAARREQLEKEHSEQVLKLRGDTGRALLSGISRDIVSRIEASVKRWADEASSADFKLDPREVHQVVTAHLDGIAQSLIANGVDEGVKVFELYRRREFSDYKPDEDDINALQQARLNKDWRAAGAITLSMALKAQQDKFKTEIEPEIRKDERKKVLDELRKDAEARKQTQAAQARQEKPRPTAAQAQGAPASGLKASYERLNAMSTDQFFRLSREDQKKLVDEANEFTRQVAAGRG